jgi:hypothetical protein
VFEFLSTHTSISGGSADTLHSAFEVNPLGSSPSSVVTIPTPVGNAPMIAKNVARSIRLRQPPVGLAQR